MNIVSMLILSPFKIYVDEDFAPCMVTVQQWSIGCLSILYALDIV